MAKPLTITTSLDSCVPQMDLALQGNLFGEPETPAQTRAQTPRQRVTPASTTPP